MALWQAFSLLFCCLLVSCRTTTEGGGKDSGVLADAQSKQVISVCFATQGNGFNYAATLSWIAETLYLNLERSKQMESAQPGTSVFFDLNCISGSSSGSLVSNIYGAMLTNPSFTKNQDPDRLLTGAEVERFADGLRWMAMSADLTVQSYLNTVGQVIGEWVERVARKAVGATPGFKEIWAEVLGAETPSWWDGSFVDAEQIIVDFMANTLVAKRITYGTFQERDEVGRLIHFPYFSSFQDIPQAQRKNIDQGLSKRSKTVNQISESFLQNEFPLGGYLTRYSTGVYSNKNSPLYEIASEPMPVGTCTLTMAALFDTQKDVPLERLSYRMLRPMMFCDEKTIVDLMGQKSFQDQLNVSGSMAQRLVLFAAKNRRVSMAMSLREPKMMRPFLGTLGDSKLEVTRYFDPQNSKHRSQPQLWPIDGKKLAITGGYLDRRMNAWAISYYFASRVERLKKAGYRVSPYLYLFGKPDKDRDKKFDSTVIRELFSSAPQEVESHLNDWVSIQKQFCSSQMPFLADSLKIETHTTAYNWDMKRQPAALTGSSRLIAYKSANAVRLQTPDFKPARVAFDPQPEIPEPIAPGRVVCIE